MVLLVMLGATFLLSIYLLGVTIRKYSILSTTAKIAGVAPSVTLAALLFGLFVFLAY